MNSTAVRPVRVAYWNNIPSPYFVDRFNALADRGVVEFEGWFNRRTEVDRTWRVDEESWRFAGRVLPRRRVAGREISIVTEALRTFKPDVLISLYAEPSFVLGWQYARRRSVMTAFRVLAPSEVWHPRHKGKELLKLWMFRRVDGLLVPGPDATAYARSYGVPPERLFDEPQVVDSDFFRREVEISRTRRQVLRRELAVTGVVFLYVGRLWWGKGVSDLVDAFSEVQSVIEDTSLVIVGDGPDEGALRERIATLKLRNVTFAGFRQQEELPALLAAADVFVFPSLGDPYGLVVDEAMSGGLPVVSTTSVGEVHERVRDGDTGLVVPPANPAALAGAMLGLAKDAGLRAKLGTNASLLMHGRTPALWAKQIERAACELASRRVQTN